MPDVYTPLALVLFYALLIFLRVSQLPPASERCEASLGKPGPLRDVRDGGAERPANVVYPNFVHADASSGTVCKAYDFRSTVHPVLASLSFLSSSFVKITSLSLPPPFPVPFPLSINPWNFTYIDTLIPHTLSTSGYHGALTSPLSLSSPSRLAHCRILAAGFVDMDAGVLHNVVVDENTGAPYIVDSDSFIPVYLYFPLLRLLPLLRINATGTIFEPMEGDRKERACLDAVEGFTFVDGVKMAAYHYAHYARGQVYFVWRGVAEVGREEGEL